MDPSKRLTNTWIITESSTVALLFSKRMSGFPNNSILMLRGEVMEHLEHCGDGDMEVAAQHQAGLQSTGSFPRLHARSLSPGGEEQRT